MYKGSPLNLKPVQKNYANKLNFAIIDPIPIIEIKLNDKVRMMIPAKLLQIRQLIKKLTNAQPAAMK